MAKVEVPTKKKDGGGDGSRPKEKTSKKKAPKEKAAGRSKSESVAKYVIPKVIRTPDEGTAARGDARASTREAEGGAGGAPASFVQWRGIMPAIAQRAITIADTRQYADAGMSGRGAPRVRERIIVHNGIVNYVAD